MSERGTEWERDHSNRERGADDAMSERDISREREVGRGGGRENECEG